MIFTQDYNFVESFNSFLGGFSIFLIGVSMVFIALVLLILLIKLVGTCVAKIENKDKATISKKEDTVKVHEVFPVSDVPQMDELELVAAITVAIALSLGTTTDQLVVRSLRKVNRHTR